MNSIHIHSTMARKRRHDAFTLIEMLVVITIVSLLMALVVPTTNSILKANQITTATQIVVDHLSAARQTALTQNRIVEVLFFKYNAPGEMNETSEIGAIQTLIFDETNTTSEPFSEVRYLPEGAIVSSVTQYSSLMASNRAKTAWTAGDPKRALPRGIRDNYDAYRIRFRPDGSTDLGNGNWFLTIQIATDAGAPPPNHATVHIDPHNGSLRLYRPG